MMRSEAASWALPLSPRGRGREAMTYGRGTDLRPRTHLDSAAVSHLAELVRGDFLRAQRRPPHPPFGHLLPKGRRGFFIRARGVLG